MAKALPDNSGANRFKADQARTVNGHVNMNSDAANAIDSSLIIAGELSDPDNTMFYGLPWGRDGVANVVSQGLWPDNGGYKAATEGFTPKGAQVFTCPKGSNPMAGK